MENKVIFESEESIEIIIKSKKYGNKITIIDSSDFEIFNKYNWHIGYSKNNNSFYVTTNIYEPEKQSILRLHRLLMNCPEGMIVDHRNHDTLDNRKENLRIASLSENQRNSSKRKNGKTSIYKGVCFNQNSGKFTAQIQYGKIRLYLGLFDNDIDAAIAYNKAALKYYGEFANLNVIPEVKK